MDKIIESEEKNLSMHTDVLKHESEKVEYDKLRLIYWLKSIFTALPALPNLEKHKKNLEFDNLGKKTWKHLEFEKFWNRPGKPWILNKNF